MDSYRFPAQAISVSLLPKSICKGIGHTRDILKRHVASHNPPDAISKRPVASSVQTVPGRVSQACRVCASIHIRCTEQKPCWRCTERGIECDWDRSLEIALTPSPAIAETAESKTSSPNHLLNPYGIPPRFPSNGGLPDFSLESGQGTQIRPLDFDLDISAELDDIDLRFLDAYNTHVPFEFLGRSPDNNATEVPGPEARPDPCRPAAICTEAFRHYWKFRPNSHDHGAAEEHNLSLPSVTDDHASPESRIPVDRLVTCGRLTVATRDKILTTIVQTCRSENLSRAITSFPSVELLDTLLQYYLTSPVARADSFLHTATFDPNQKRPELLAAMVACGAVLTSDPALSKLGFAIQESVRVNVPKHWEEHNALTRDLELLQAFLIILEMGVWSGRTRKVEIAEGLLQPILTMLRRNGKLRRWGYPKISVLHDDDGESLMAKWRTWVEQESFKRLSFRLLQHDTNCSMALLVNPLISYAEVLLPFPTSANLWAELTPGQWKAAILSHKIPNPDRPLSLAEYVDDPASLDANKLIVDTTIVSFAFLSCAWSLSWELIQLNSLQRAGSRRWNTLLMTSRHDEIQKLLNNFRLSADFSHPATGEVTMNLELIHMHLHMSFEDIQLFAGMEGPDQARIVYPMILEWVNSESARKAVSHGGQIIRAARLLPNAAIWGPAAIAVYHASLVLWVFGLLSESPELPGAWAGRTAPPVYLDDREGIALQRFTQLSSGSPCIRDSSGSASQDAVVSDAAYLSQPDRVMAVVVGIMMQNHGELARPRLVNNLIQLMKGLQKATTKQGPSYG
ncbi:uncharacterized protein MKZ38_009960 [Zalerion maritima]|uniref:Zn(2)-C6 fungal-type domain-containing protein n=1 Tax=Zalerion maritima TaxID=339359 RepID=A0AAD5RU44_9PEZI|nr:uncharacterized protein MKZ38_009960 [Zalerion maritima]